MSKSRRSSKPGRGVIAAALCTVFLALPCSITCYSQSLDKAVNRQLEIVGSSACARLLRGDTLDVLEGSLFTICDRGLPTPGVGPSASTGGGTATPTTLPSIVQQRLREARGKDKQQPVPKITAASADSTVSTGSRVGVFVSVNGEQLDRNITDFEDGYDSNVQQLTAGVDFGITPQWVAGVALDASRQDLDFDGGGGSDADSYGLFGFASFLPTQRTFVQLFAGYARNSYTRNRVGTFTQFNSSGVGTTYPLVPGSQNADYDSDQYRAGILIGYDQPIGRVTISPFAGVDWWRTKVGAFSETGSTGLELNFYDDEIDSLQSSIGAQALLPLRAGSWILVPQMGLSWRHEFENDQRTLQVSFVYDTRGQRFTYQTNPPDRDWGEIDAGILAVLPNGLQVFANYRAIFENSLYDSQAVTLGARVPF